MLDGWFCCAWSLVRLPLHLSAAILTHMSMDGPPEGFLPYMQVVGSLTTSYVFATADVAT